MAERSRKGIKAEKPADEIRRQLRDYSDEVKATVTETAKDVAEKAAERLREESPKRTGKYRKHWTVSMDRNGVIVHQSGKSYRLTHLLEKGHALRRGGRKIGESPSYPHIEKVEKETVDEFVSRIERKIKQ